MGQWFLTLSRTIKRLITISVDFISLMLSLWVAFSLRLGELYQVPVEQIWIFFLAPMVAIPIFIRFGLYRAIIRYISIDALGSVIQAVLLFSLIFSVIVLLSSDLAGVVPRTVYAINAIIVVLFVGGSRMMARWLFNQQRLKENEQQHQHRVIPPVLIYGAGDAGVQLCAVLKHSKQMRPVGFIDDNPSLHHQRVDGIPVFNIKELDFLIEKFKVSDLLLALPSVSRYQRSQIINALERYPVHVRTLPDLLDIAEGRIEAADIQEVAIEDLLGRDIVEPNQTLLDANVKNKVVMVTGAGGSIGSELCRQLITLEPTRIILFERCELNLYSIEKELLQLDLHVPIVSVLGSVTDKERIKQVCTHFSVATIYHAAAYKHVPMVEKNISEGIRNNIFGTLQCTQAAIETKVETFVLVSTDKAVRPTNTMGASKRFAELILQALSLNDELTTKFTMVRFGNVLDSSGSVVPLFREQIANGGPVTVTHPDIIRYFMTIPEASQLVIQAGAMGQGGDLFVLDMGEPVRVLELAQKMIRLSGFSIRDENNPDGDIEIRYTGLRPGEKLYEELLIGDNVSETEHQKIMRAQEQVIDWERLNLIIEQLQQAIAVNDNNKLRELLLDTIEGYQPQCGIEDWLHQACKLKAE